MPDRIIAPGLWSSERVPNLGVGLGDGEINEGGLFAHGQQQGHDVPQHHHGRQVAPHLG